MPDHDPSEPDDAADTVEPDLSDIKGTGTIGLTPIDRPEPDLHDVGGTSTIADDVHPTDGVF